MKFQEGSILKYLNLRIFQSPISFSVYQTDHIMGLVNEWYPTGNLIRVDTTFRTNSTYENELMAELPLTGHTLCNVDMEYYGKFVHTIGWIQHIAIMNRIDICYTACSLETQTVAPTLPGLQSIKRCIQYIASHPHKPIFYPSNSYDVSILIRLTWSGNKVE